jgi:alpha-galactosidase
MGMNASDYGGGTPVVDVWRRDVGLAVGHVETQPRLVSLPIQSMASGVQISITTDQEIKLAPGQTLNTPECFVAVHAGDYFATLDTYRRIMAQRGIASPTPPESAYEPMWCAWGYEREFSLPLVQGTLGKVRELGFKWAVIDDGWQTMTGDWNVSTQRFPQGEADMKALVTKIKANGLKPRLWLAPLAVAPGSDILHDHTDMLLLDKEGATQNVTWWNSFYICPAYEKTRENTRALVRKILGDWGFEGLKIDGQHLNGVAPCYNPAHKHARPEESVEQLQLFYKTLYDTAREVNPDAVVEVCPCGTAYAFHNMPFMNQAPASDPLTSWQVRHKGKTLKALMGPSAAYAGDHVELSDRGDDFASTVGIGAVVSSKFTWPIDPKPKDSFLLSPARELDWRKWVQLYSARMLPKGRYRGELYDIGFDKPETHVVEKDGCLHYAFYAEKWHGVVTLRGLKKGAYTLYDYVNKQNLGRINTAKPQVKLNFNGHLLIEARPV